MTLKTQVPIHPIGFLTMSIQGMPRQNSVKKSPKCSSYNSQSLGCLSYQTEKSIHNVIIRCKPFKINNFGIKSPEMAAISKCKS